MENESKYFHIFCTFQGKVLYEGRFVCRSKTDAINILKEKLKCDSLRRFAFKITEIPVDIIVDIVKAVAKGEPIPEGDIVMPQPIIPNPNASSDIEKYGGIKSYKLNPYKPTTIGHSQRHLGED